MLNSTLNRRRTASGMRHLIGQPAACSMQDRTRSLQRATSGAHSHIPYNTQLAGDASVFRQVHPWWNRQPKLAPRDPKAHDSSASLLCTMQCHAVHESAAASAPSRPPCCVDCPDVPQAEAATAILCERWPLLRLEPPAAVSAAGRSATTSRRLPKRRLSSARAHLFTDWRGAACQHRSHSERPYGHCWAVHSPRKHTPVTHNPRLCRPLPLSLSPPPPILPQSYPLRPQAHAATVTEGSPDPQAAVASAFTRRYAASGGTEIFISFETPEPHQLICGFLRLSALCLRTRSRRACLHTYVPRAAPFRCPRCTRCGLCLCRPTCCTHSPHRPPCTRSARSARASRSRPPACSAPFASGLFRCDPAFGVRDEQPIRLQVYLVAHSHPPRSVSG